MKLFSLPKKINGLIFDIDQTLYRHNEYYSSQEELQIKYYAELEKILYETAEKKIKEYRESGKKSGKQPSLGNTFKHFGYSVQDTVFWREALFTPEKYLCTDEKLVTAVKFLFQKYKLIAVTNNAELIGWKTLKALGVDKYFNDILGLHANGVSKPAAQPFINAAEKIAVPVLECVSVGDRFHVDLEIPIELGMGGILVESMEDVYTIPEIL